MPNKVANELRELRLALQMSQAQFAAMVGCSHGSLSQYETHRIEWPDYHLKDLRKTVSRFLLDRHANDLAALAKLTFTEPEPKPVEYMEIDPQSTRQFAVHLKL